MRLEWLVGDRILREYAGLETARVSPELAWRKVVSDKDTVAAIYDIESQSFLSDLAEKRSHAKLIWDLSKRGIKNPHNAARAYWLPGFKTLFMYQLATSSGRMIDPPDQVVSLIVQRLGIEDNLDSVQVID